MKILRVRRGFTFIELAVGIVVLGIFSVGITRFLMAQMRFYEKQASTTGARRVSRSSINRLVADIRVVDADSGVVAATSADITLRVPYAMGLSCNRQTLSILPVDSTVYAGGVGGIAWRGAGSYYQYVEGNVTINASSSTVCSDSSVQVMTADGGRQVSLSPSLGGGASPKGTVVFLIRRVRYQFKASTLVPGATGLYRQVMIPLGTEEEIATPFASTAKFRFFANNSATAQDAVPTLTTIRGFELILDGKSEKSTVGEASARTEKFTTAVFFKNRRN